jgi:hypothetical protein
VTPARTIVVAAAANEKDQKNEKYDHGLGGLIIEDLGSGEIHLSAKLYA